MPNYQDKKHKKNSYESPGRGVELMSGHIGEFQEQARLGHPNKMFRFPSADRPIFFPKVKKKKKKKIPDSLVKKASNLIYKHTIV